MEYSSLQTQQLIEAANALVVAQRELTATHRGLIVSLERASVESGEVAGRVAGYTKMLTWLTVLIAIGTLIQAVFATLVYLYPPAH